MYLPSSNKDFNCAIAQLKAKIWLKVAIQNSYKLAIAYEKQRHQQFIQQLAINVAQIEKGLSLLIQNSYELILVINREINIYFVSSSVEQVLGYTSKYALMKINFLSLTHPADLGQAQQFLRELLAFPGRIYHARFRLKHADGTWRSMQLRGCNPLPVNFHSSPITQGLIISARDT
jgi:PAS domain S-box-containing protein